MGIWIRTQDKETLINCECIQVNELYSRDDGFCLKTDIDGSPVYLGAYKTKEKASPMSRDEHRRRFYELMNKKV